MPLCSLTEKFELPAPVEKVFHRFTNTEEIIRSIPPFLRFRINRRSALRLNQGFCVEFQIRICYLPVRCKSYVQSFSINRHFTCVLQNGWLNSWEYDCYFEPLPGNRTRVTECVLYRLPWGWVGNLANRWLIRPCLHRIYTHHRTHLIRIFQP